MLLTMLLGDLARSLHENYMLAMTECARDRKRKSSHDSHDDQSSRCETGKESEQPNARLMKMPKLCFAA